MKKAIILSALAGADAWQLKLDRALLSVDAPLGDRLKDLREVAQHGPTVAKDVFAAVSSLSSGSTEEFIDTLYPKGTTARSDIEGLRALRTQVSEIAPPKLPDAGSAPSFETPKPEDVSKAAEEVSAAVSALLTDREKQEELKEEVKNAFRSTPKGLETPEYEVVATLGDVELRRYAPYSVAKTTMAADGASDSVFSSESGGQGFNTLASYLFGKNDADASMSMTMPVEISSSAGAGGSSSMAFVLPSEYADAPPAPLADGIDIEKVPERLVAVRAFPGFVTEPEVQRQLAAVVDALEADAGASTAWTRGAWPEQYSTLQYNAPYTLPWRRRNEIAVVVEAPQEAGAAPTAAAAQVETEAPSGKIAMLKAEGEATIARRQQIAEAMAARK